MAEQSSKHGPVQDSRLAQEARGMVHGGRPEREQEWADQQQHPRPGTPPGMDDADVELRTEIARFLGLDAFPGDREWLVQVAVRNGATDEVLDLLRRLPAEERFVNVQDVATSLGLGSEAHRF